MRYVSVLASLFSAAVLVVCMVLTGSPFAGAAAMAPHEKTVEGPNGFRFTVGHSGQAFHPVAPLNGMPTNREVFLDDTFYGRVEAGGTGTLKAGYLVACAVDLTVGIDLGAAIGFDGGFRVGGSSSSDSASSGVDASLGPDLSIGASIDLSITPGKVQPFEVGTKELPTGSTGYFVSRDFHVSVQDCGGPLTIRSYTIVEAQSPEVSGREAVYGDPIFL
ncbi:MspA protein [Nocardia amikacinitolerans]|uniref:MspA protein n=1 Tax=Nocardia amikacinitolerans TaxID=756689 RepID=A0A285LSZ2_9NOCA|nr:MspA family porin [Nocardia amikacinitolerans]MCP2295521.1 MspA protein [Nocardia amikacinitolerans]SNY88042.1 MspA protein [Nocardia amikacinitolerans]